MVVDRDSHVVFEKSSSSMLTPASCLKLFTVTGALGLLGTNHSFETRIYVDGKVSDGVVGGDLNLVCEHDVTWCDSVFPSNAIAPLLHIANQLKAKGLTEVQGKVQCFGACFYDPDGARRMHNPEKQADYNGDAAKAFRDALLKCGIALSTNADAVAGGQGFSAPGSLFYTHKSSDVLCKGKPLTFQAACADLLKNSDNVMADGLLRHVGYELEGQDSYEAGSIEVMSWLTNKAKVRTNGMVYRDGSGLSHENACCAAQLVAILKYARRTFAGFDQMLSISCTDGTLEKRFCGTAAAGKVFAKTGSLRNCAALSGFLEDANGSPRYVFSFIANNRRIDLRTARKVIDQMVVELAKEH
jgi:D-alanyl-D-alanine carboxypeptidase/D-alanyl-D-alanine-endopeptidase (penicillin-binding protein 4)